MNSLTRRFVERNIVRRKTDHSIIRQNERLNRLYKMGQVITSEMNLNVLFELIIEQINDILGTERSTVFLYDPNKDELWSLVATRMGKNKIRVPADSHLRASQIHRFADRLRTE